MMYKTVHFLLVSMQYLLKVPNWYAISHKKQVLLQSKNLNTYLSFLLYSIQDDKERNEEIIKNK